MLEYLQLLYGPNGIAQELNYILCILLFLAVGPRTERRAPSILGLNTPCF